MVAVVVACVVVAAAEAVGDVDGFDAVLVVTLVVFQVGLKSAYASVAFAFAVVLAAAAAFVVVTVAVAFAASAAAEP